VQQQFADSGSWDMARLETGLREALMKDGCRILEALLNQPGALGTVQPEGQLHEIRSRRVQSLLGPFELRRGYYHSGDRRLFPMDTLLGLTDSYTPGLAKLMCRAAGMDGAYEEASQTLELYAGVEVPASQVRRLAQEIGYDLGTWNPRREELRCGEVPTLYIACDGTGVPMRKEETRGRRGKAPDGTSATREVKLGCVFSSHGVDEKGHPVRDESSTTYVASFEPAGDFGLKLRQEAVLRGMAKARRMVFIGDGACWVWNLARTNFPGCIEILDFYHACEHLAVLADALWPNPKPTEQVKRWIKCLKAGQLRKVLAQATRALPHHGPRRAAALREIEYFKTNSARMQYNIFRKQGLFIGSGVVEAGCKTVVGKRAKQSGMFWRIPGAQHVLNIRCAVLGQTYDAYWCHRRQTQLQSLKIPA